MSEKTASNEYPEQDAEIRLVIKIKQNSMGIVKGYVHNLEVKNYEGLIQNVTQLVREYEFQRATDTIIEVMIAHISGNRVQ